jgi:hypothetical protein
MIVPKNACVIRGGLRSRDYFGFVRVNRRSASAGVRLEIQTQLFECRKERITP